MNESSELKPQWFYSLLVLCVVMTATNVYLFRANKSLKLRSQSAAQIPVGTLVSEISGLDSQGAPIHVSTYGKKATVLMVYSPTCPYCERNWPTWSSLINRVHNQDVQFEVVDVTASATKEFVSRKNPGRADIIRRIDPKEYMTLNLNLTPETIVIGSDSKVKAVIAGVLSDSDVEKLNGMLI